MREERTERVRPECAYVFIENGKRTMRCVFDLKSQTELMIAFEPVLMSLEAELEFTPCATAEELAAGFKAAFG